MAPINFLATFFAAVLSMITGSLWYGPLFGKQWSALGGATKERMEQAKAKGMVKSYGLMFIGSLLMSYVLANALVFAATYLKTSGAGSGVMVGFFNWAGFIAPVTLGVVLWEGKSWKLWLINNGYYLVTLILMGILLALWT